MTIEPPGPPGPPPAFPPPPPLPGEGSFRRPPPYRHSGGLAAVTIALLALGVVVAIIAVWSLSREINLLDLVDRTGRISLEAANANDDRQQAVGGAFLGLFGLTAISWLVWQYRAHANLPALGARETRYTPGWAAGWWFVPFANLVKPPQAVSELVRSSDPSGGADEWKRRPTPGVIWVWWTFFILSRIVGAVSSVGRPFSTIADTRRADRVGQASFVLIAAAGVLAIVIVRRVVASQRARAAAVAPPQA